MTKRRAERILAVAIVISAFLLLLSLFGVLESPWPHATSAKTELEGQVTTTTKVDGAKTSGTPQQTDDPDANPTAQVTGPLPITDNDPDALLDNGTLLRLWPETSAVPVLRDVTREAFIGREYGSTALDGITVILDPGHGGTDTGHGSFPAASEQPIYEKDVTLEIATRLAERLRELGATVLLTRTADTELSLFYRVAFAADQVLLQYEQEASLYGYDIDAIRHLRPLMSDVMRINQGTTDSGGRGIFGSIGTEPDLRLIYDIERQYGDVIFISIQTNADQDTTIRGAKSVYMGEAFIQETNNSYVGDADVADLAPNYNAYHTDDRFRLAALLQAHIVNTIPALEVAEENIREEDMAVLRLTNLTSAVIEVGYLSNADDVEILTSTQGQTDLTIAMSNAIYQYFCHAE